MYKLLIPVLVFFSFLSCKKTTQVESKKEVSIPPGNNVLYASVKGYYSAPPDKYGIYTNADTGANEWPLIESKTSYFDAPIGEKMAKFIFSATSTVKNCYRSTLLIQMGGTYGE